MTYSILGDSSILFGNPGSVDQGSYQISYDTSLVGITGVRLEVLEDPSLPTNGPGLASNGNFVLTELSLDHQPEPVPEPSGLALALLALLGLARAPDCLRAVS